MANPDISLMGPAPKLSVLTRASAQLENAKGRIAVPILLYLLGVPGIVVIALWAFFFRGR